MKALKNDLTIYENYAHEWWEKGSEHFASLQNISPFRLALIREFAGNLRGKNVLDLGCGGGLLALPLIKDGAYVTAVDSSPASIKEAMRVSCGKGNFICQDICSYKASENFYDLVLLADVIDHIKNYGLALKVAATALNNQGLLIVSTINRTMLSRFLAITVGEGLKLIPPGTHDWKMFVKPSELKKNAEIHGLEQITITGEWPQILKSLRNKTISVRKSRSTALGYVAVFKKRLP
jgi:2-polyprenyl-6-hydroxyphenyl methylase/3-demethylubiquinone-9 3-methyltransferase